MAGVIVTIGDYVDKGGRQSKAVVDRLLPGVGEGWTLVALKGKPRCHDGGGRCGIPRKMAAWIAKGGDAALASYGGDPAAVPQTHLDWLDGLRPMHLDAHRLYVHAGVDPEIPLDRQSETTLAMEALSEGIFRWLRKASRRPWP